jgi:hypothetical protein
MSVKFSHVLAIYAITIGFVLYPAHDTGVLARISTLLISCGLGWITGAVTAQWWVDRQNQ